MAPLSPPAINQSMRVRFLRYSAYAAVPEDCRPFCCAHLLRNFRAMTDRGGASEPIGQRLQKSGQELIHHWNHLHRDETVRSTFDTHYRRPSNQCSSLFMFVHADGVSPTNNAAEQSLRKAVIFRKLSYGTESYSGSLTLPVVLSVIETCRRLGRNALDWITAAVTRTRGNRPLPRLRPDA